MPRTLCRGKCPLSRDRRDGVVCLDKQFEVIAAQKPVTSALAASRWRILAVTVVTLGSGVPGEPAVIFMDFFQVRLP